MEPPRRQERQGRREPDARIDALAFTVIGAAIEVHRALGPGYLESAYEKAMAVELSLRGIPYQRQCPVQVKYKDQVVGDGVIDMLVAETLVVELKAADGYHPIHTAQVMSYLKATSLPLGLLINFNVGVLKEGVRRIVLTS